MLRGVCHGLSSVVCFLPEDADFATSQLRALDPARMIEERRN